MHERALQFITLKDAHGVTQFIVPDNKRDTLCEVVKGLKFESVLQVKGKVIRRPEGQENPKMPTGDIEVEIEDLKVLNPSLAELPFKTRDYEEITENVRLQYRYLDIRHYKMQKNLRIRSNMVMKMREFLCNKLGFVDVETPTLFRRTPGGAREFVVPTKIPGKFYCLPQSPQQVRYVCV
ncbi:aspartate--tRNA ligase, mitochondrial-like [Lingula anatina]|uniref:Aspartate--tRNA ligase, mitochondrial-like n=1 Tax=Lingula anatina TaxID=7574 RepID=A0A1S3ID36_LINAN|nr:aspartate--tRNA ligase, mitochondrial-like [Lingula anatina]|eukprot:XP_013396175.1 aspartate--tRNA ligase, mitochondrial-like [Lingula anatina]